MVGREVTIGVSTDYRYTLNGQEKESELNRNITSATFWMYDSRSGRRWNIDPRPNISVSPYSCFSGNSIWNSDPFGDTSIIRPDGKMQDIGNFKFETFDGNTVSVNGLQIQPMKGSLKSFTVEGDLIDNGAARFVATFKNGQFVEYVWDKKLSHTWEDFLSDVKEHREEIAEFGDEPWFESYNSPEEARKSLINVALSVALPNPILKRTTALANAAPKGFKVNGQLATIWGDRKLFVNWLKGNHSVGGTALNSTQAQQVIDNARKLGINRIDLNKAGLLGKEITGKTAGIAHFKIENVHILIEKGLESILK